MARRRFKAPSLDEPMIRIDGREANHALRVLRLNQGDTVTLFDGHGREVTGQISAVHQDAFDVAVQQPMAQSFSEVPTPPIYIASAVPKGPRADWLVEKCAELGVHGLWWLNTRRGIVAPGEGKLERWRRKAGEAAKQALLSKIMEIRPPQTIEGILENLPRGTTPLYGDPAPTSETLTTVVENLLRRPATDGLAIFIGPEGGWTEDEKSTLDQLGALPVRFAHSILRVETAAVAAAAIATAARIPSRLTPPP